MEKTIFQKIIDREIKADIVYEDNEDNIDNENNVVVVHYCF